MQFTFSVSVRDQRAHVPCYGSFVGDSVDANPRVGELAALCEDTCEEWCGGERCGGLG